METGVSYVVGNECFHEDDSVQYPVLFCGIPQKRGLMTSLAPVRWKQGRSEHVGAKFGKFGNYNGV